MGTIYEVILENSPKKEPLSGGNLHEELWCDLLYREDAAFRTVRLAKGDKGIDGITFIDPLTGECKVYQAKFTKKLTVAQKKEICKSFITPFIHNIKCISWVLLIPIQPSTDELIWINNDLKNEAIKMPQIIKNKRAQKMINKCKIDIYGENKLEELLNKHLDIACSKLPRSIIALKERIEAYKTKQKSIEESILSKLDFLHAEELNKKSIATRRAKAFLKSLNQGWLDHYGMLEFDSTKFGLRNAPNVNVLNSLIHNLDELMSFTDNSMIYASQVEGLIEGITDKIGNINHKARLLKQLVIMKQISDNKVTDSDIKKAISEIVNVIKDLQNSIAFMLRAIYGMS